MDDKLQLPFEYINLTSDELDIWSVNDLISMTDMMGVFLCISGSVEGSIDSKRYPIKKRDLFAFTPSLYVRILNRSDDFQGIVIVTNYEFVIPLINKVMNIHSQLSIRNNPCISLSEKQFLYIKDMMVSLDSRIKMENSSDIDPQRKVILRELIMSLQATMLYELVNIFFTNTPIQPFPQDRKDIIVQKFYISTYRNYRLEHDVAFYAKEQYLSPSYFSTIIKSKTGKSALQWIIEMILTDAKQMLQYTNASIKEIAIRLNFPTQSFFGKYFKQYIGISPKEYRKQHSLNK